MEKKKTKKMKNQTKKRLGKIKKKNEKNNE
jgi:hypothetical protein